MGNIIPLRSDFLQGYQCAKEEYASGELYCVESSLMTFVLDPADSDFQRGFEQGLKNLIQKRKQS